MSIRRVPLSQPAHAQRSSRLLEELREAGQLSDAVPIIIELAGIQIDADRMRARLRVRIVAPADSDISVSRRDLEEWVEQMEIQPDSLAVISQRIDQMLAAVPAETDAVDWRVSAGATVTVECEIRNRVFRVDKPGVAYVHMPSFPIGYTRLRDNSQKYVRIEDLQSLEVR